MSLKIHSTITAERVCEAVERCNTSLDNPGFCLACGEEAEGVEPDAEGYVCESCDALAVMGAEQLLFLVC